MERTIDLRRQSGTEPLIRWSAIFSGGVIGVAGLGLLTSLWVAIGYGSDVTWFRDQLDWLVGASAIVAMFVAGWVAGWLSGARGPVVGLWHGLTVWGLALITLVSVTLPSVASNGGFPSPTSATSSAALSPAFYTGTTLWAFFFAVLIGVAAAAIGGAVGGATPEAEIDLVGEQQRRTVPAAQDQRVTAVTRNPQYTS